MLAADVRAGEAEAVAQEVGEEQTRLDLLAHGAPVDGQLDVHALRSARSTSTPVRWLRYAGDAWTCPGGSTSLAARAPGLARQLVGRPPTAIRAPTSASTVGRSVTAPTRPRTV